MAGSGRKNIIKQFPSTYGLQNDVIVHPLLTQLAPVATVDVVDVIAVFCQKFRIASIESQAVAARFQFGDIVVTFPVFVARDVVGVEAEIVGAFEVLLAHGCKTSKRQRMFVGCQSNCLRGIGGCLVGLIATFVVTKSLVVVIVT